VYTSEFIHVKSVDVASSNMGGGGGWEVYKERGVVVAGDAVDDADAED